MGFATSIEWCHHTFNPWRGCAHAQLPDGREHPGCAHCYAESGFGRRFGVRWGDVSRGGSREVAADSTWRQPLAWAQRARLQGVRERVFCASLADVLDSDAPVAAQERLWELIRATAVRCNNSSLGRALFGCGCTVRSAPGLDWLLLTKRPQRWAVIPPDVRALVWLGTSVSDQSTADALVPELLRASGFRVRFLSVEPLLAPLSLARWMAPPCLGRQGSEGHWRLQCSMWTRPPLHWVIVGGESGPRARPMEAAWAQQLRDECARSSVPFFFKQWGGASRAPRGRELEGRHWDELPWCCPPCRTPSDIASTLTHEGHTHVG